MIRIVKRIRKGIAENGCGLFERNFVFSQIDRRFFFVPIKAHNLNITASVLFFQH